MFKQFCVDSIFNENFGYGAQKTGSGGPRCVRVNRSISYKYGGGKDMADVPKFIFERTEQHVELPRVTESI